MRRCSGRANLRADPANAMSFLSLVAHQVIELRHRLEIMKVRSAKERVILYLHLNAGPDGRTVDVRSQLRLVRHHEPATVAILEHIRHESIKAQRIAILP